MAKFPSQRKIMYAGATVSNGGFAETHTLCLPKDLSLLNRRGYASTTRKGVPLVYRVAATVYPTGIDGSGYTTSVSSDVRTTVKYLGCQNNWVMKNAAVKFHAAREKMFRKAGVKKNQRGSYSHEIRYGFDDLGAFATPVDGAGSAFTGGTWDLSSLSHASDSDVGLVLVGNGDDEETDASALTFLSLGHSYLMSRLSQQADTNLQAEEGPAKFSYLNQMLSDNSQDYTNKEDDVIDEARNAQDNPPYEVLDISDSGDVGHDITEPVELGRSVLMPQGSGASLPQTTILDVPFGIMRVQMAHRDPGDDSGITDDLALGLEVLDIFEMQG